MFLIWLQFFISAVIIIIAGAKLSLYANVISERTGLSKAWIGMVLLGVVTSLPELATSLASAVRINAPDLALGNVLGSNIFNLMIIVLLDFLYKSGSITSKANTNRAHIFSATLTLLLSTVVIAGIFINSKVAVLNIGNFGLDSIMIAIIYIIGMRLIFKFETEKLSAQAMDKQPVFFRYKPLHHSYGGNMGLTLSKSYVGFIVAAILVISSGIWLAGVGEEIAKATGWGRTFVGTILLAIVTSFPELVVSVTALRLGSIDLAFGNIFGSNMLNLFIIPITDIAYRAGAILTFVSQTHILTACLGIFLTCVVIIGLIRREKKSILHLSWDTIVMVLGYLFGTYMLFRLG